MLKYNIKNDKIPAEIKENRQIRRLYMNIQSLQIQIELTPKERNFLLDFFGQTNEFLETEDMLSSENIKLYADSYIEYLNNSEYKDNESLYLFYYELKNSERREQMVENGSINLSPKERIFRKAMPASKGMTKCKNSIINKWREEARVLRTVSKAEIDKINKSLEPILQSIAYGVKPKDYFKDEVITIPCLRKVLNDAYNLSNIE